MNFSDYELDPKLVESGVWCELDGSHFLIASFKNPNYRRALAKLERRFQNRPRGSASEDPIQKDREQVDLMARFILLDWRNVEKRGQPYPYNYENACAALTTTSTAARFMLWVVEQAGEDENFRPRANGPATSMGEEDEVVEGKAQPERA